MPTTYPLDLTGVAPSNLVTNELHTFSTAASRFFIPSAGPFFTIGLVVRHGVTNVLLQPDTQYKILHLHREASLASGKEVCAIIVIVDPAIPSVLISYQVIGGIYSNTASVIQDLLDNNPIDPSDMVSWQNIFGAPVQFPPTEHLHHFDNIYGAEELVAVLERLRMAIAAGDSPAISAIYQYIHTLLTNLNYTTEQDVIDLIGDGPVQYVKTYKTFNDLRAEEFLINNESYLYVATGKTTVNDKNGRVFMWDITSMADDDNDMVLRPHHIIPNSPGRFVSMLGVETELRDALATIGRKIDASGNILTKLDDIFTLDAFDLNAAVNSGLFFVKSNCINKPAGNTQGHLFVEKSATHIVQHYISTVQDDRNMVSEDNINISVPTTHVFNRVGHLVTGIYVWEEWRGLIDRHTLNYLLKTLGRKIEDDFTINTDISSFITVIRGNTDLNDVTKPGIYPLVANADNSTPHTNWPKGLRTALLRVEKTDLGTGNEFIFQEIIAGYDNDEFGDPVTESPFIDSQVKPTIYRRISNVGNWSGWFKTMDTQDALRHGLTTDGIAIRNTVPALTGGSPTDLNTYTMPGKYWVGTGIVNSAFNWGILEVELIGGTATESGEVIQTMRSPQNNGRYSQRMRYWDAPFSQYVWSDWITLAKQNGDISQVFEADYPLSGASVYHVINGAKLATEFQTLWDILYKYGIQNAIGSANTIPNGIDLQTVTEPGKYWFDDSHVNRPFNWGILDVELIGGTIASPGEVLHTARWDGRVATCSRNYLGVWSDWRFIKNRDIGNERLLIGVDLGAITEDDNYACNTCTNAPETYGILTVKRETSALIYQTFHSRTNTVYTRTTSDGGVTWTLWKNYVERNDVVFPKETNLGVTIKYFGNNSALVPSYIGENDFATVDVTIFISGEYKTIPLGDIALKFSADDGVISPNGGFGYVYLIDNADVYTLETTANSGPGPTPLGSYTNKRQVLCWPGEDPKTSNKIFIGIVQRGDDRYTKVRNWYQDPGMCKHFAITENSPQNIHLLPTVNGPVVKMGLLRDAKVVGTAQDYFYSDYYGETLNRVTFLAWAGERIDISLNAEVALQVASAVLRGARIRLGVLHPGGSTVCVTEAGLLNHSIANAHTNTILQHIHLSDSFVAPVTGMYSLLPTGWTSNADATLFIKGSDGNDDLTTTSLKAVLNQVHAYRSLVFKDVAGDPEVLTITVMTSLRNVQLSSLFIAEHGSFASHPLLGEIILNVPNGIVIGSDFTNQPALYVDWAVPEGVTIRLRIVGIVMGKGGEGGDPQTGVVVTAEKGGDAILSVRPLIIEETGVIAGGGGGGGPGSQNGAPVGVGYGGAGGGGAGDNFGVGGTAQGSAGNGSPGGTVVGGNGGNGTQSPLSGGDYSVGGNGGKGGDLGQPGSSGTAGASHYGVTRAGAGGAAGKAIVSSQPVSFPNGQGFIHGAIDAIIV